jgi:predicted outer membrane protein
MRTLHRSALTAALVYAAALPITGVAQQATQAASTTEANPLPQPDKDFVQAASQSGSTEIDAAKLAMKRSNDKDVKSFARHMVLAHTKLTIALKAAAPHGVRVPKDNSDTAVLDSLNNLSGKEFDAAYIQKVGVEGHRQAIQAFRTEIEQGQNAALKKAAADAMPTIQEHYRMAQQLSGSKGVTAKSE